MLQQYRWVLALCTIATLLAVLGFSWRWPGMASRIRSYAALGFSGNLRSPTGPPVAQNVALNFSNESFATELPRLYAALKPLPGNRSFVVNFTDQAPGHSQPTLGPCRPPTSQVTIGEASAGSAAGAKDLDTDGASDGGFWTPRDCRPPLSRTAVLIPYRNRSRNLDTLVPYLHRLLRRQRLQFGLFVVEQANARLFNRAKLLNVGFQMALQFQPSFDCFVFQDADKLPENPANLYDCANSPKLLISEMRRESDPSNKYIKGRLYTNFFGGAVALSREAFQKVNGNSNRYYGWGREDDELSARLLLSGYRIRAASGGDARYLNLGHGDDIVVNKMPWPYSHKVRDTMRTDGLNSLNYTVRGIYLHPMFVLIRVDL